MIQEKLYDLENQNRLLNDLNQILKEQVKKRSLHVNADYSGSILVQKDVLTNCVFSDSRGTEISEKSGKLKKIIQEKDEFFKMVNGDLLFVVLQINSTMKEILTSYKSIDKQELYKMIEKLCYKSQTILKMVYDISLFQKISSNNLILIKNTHDLSLLITKTISQLWDALLRAGCIITLDRQPNMFCYCDANKIQIVLTQLLFNAIDYSNLTFGQINVKLQYHNKSALITVQDNGIGIKPSDLDRIFQSFVQRDTTLQGEHRGCGLRLAISKRIIEAHGGMIWAESRGLDTGKDIHNSST